MSNAVAISQGERMMNARMSYNSSANGTCRLSEGLHGKNASGRTHADAYDPGFDPTQVCRQNGVPRHAATREGDL